MQITDVRLATYFLLTFSLNAGVPGPYRIDTVAGSSAVGDGGPAALAPLLDAESLAVDAAGNLYIADAGDNRVRQISANGIITSPAGTGFPTVDALNLPYGVTVDPSGNIYVADLGNNRVRRISAAGVLSVSAAGLRSPRNVVSDAAGNIYISEFTGHRISRLNLDGSITVIAGTGTAGSLGDGGSALVARLNSPAGLAFDRAGNLYVADSGNHRIRRISAGGIITTFLGTGIAGTGAAELNTPSGVAIDAFGTLYVADSGNQRIRKLTSAGVISTINVAARDVAVDSMGNVFAAAGTQVIKILSSGAQARIAGDGSYFFRGDGGQATLARLNAPAAVTMDVTGNLWISDQGNARLRMVSPSGIISTPTGPQGLNAPAQLTFDSSGNLLFADPGGSAVRSWSGTALTRLAGNGFGGYAGEGYPAPNTSLFAPTGVASTQPGIFYISDTANHRIRRVNAAGILLTVAGNGNRGNNGDGWGLSTQLDSPAGLALDVSGTLYFAESGSSRIRKLTADGEVVTLLVGTLLNPKGVALDANGNLFIADTGQNRVLMVAPDGSVSVIAGKSTAAGFSGDGGLASIAQLSAPTGLFVDNASGSIYIADTGNQRIRRLTPGPSAPSEAGLPALTVVNLATLQPGPVAPCSVVGIFGWYVNSSVAGVSFDGVSGTVLSSNWNGANTVQVPCGVADSSSTQMLIVYNGAPRTTLTLGITPVAPGLFALGGGTGQAVASNQDGTTNSAENPAAQGSIVTLYATGVGINNTVGVLVGQSGGLVQFSGDAPGLVGVTQINVQLPPDATGMVPILLLAGNVPSQAGVTLAVQ